MHITRSQPDTSLLILLNKHVRKFIEMLEVAHERKITELKNGGANDPIDQFVTQPRRPPTHLQTTRLLQPPQAPSKTLRPALCILEV